MRAAEADREDVAAERAAFMEWMETADPARLVMVDESGITVGMRQTYGYAPRGKRCIDRAPARHGRRLSLLGWIDFFGAGVVSCMWGTVKAEHFRRYIENDLLDALEPGDIVVWDNAKIHVSPELEAEIRAVGAEVKCLPRYSPDFNPIEMLWAKLKHYIKLARADTDDTLKAAFFDSAEHVTWSDAMGWFRHCGYCPLPS